MPPNGGEAVSVTPSLRGLQKWTAEIKVLPLHKNSQDLSEML